MAEPSLLGCLELGAFTPKILVTGLLVIEDLGNQDLIEKPPTAPLYIVTSFTLLPPTVIEHFQSHTFL